MSGTVIRNVGVVILLLSQPVYHMGNVFISILEMRKRIWGK